MSIDFGIVRKFFPERGFGFVTYEFGTGTATDVFFHVRNIQKDRPDLVEYLKGEGTMGSACFWYETENTSKGDQVCRVLEPSIIATIDREAFASLSRRVESFWIDINVPVPEWLSAVSVDLFGASRTDALVSDRSARIAERDRNEEAERIRLEQLRSAEEAKLRDQREAERQQYEIREQEFEQLVAEMRPLGFSHSKQLSNHIVNQQLGRKYENISGVVKMRQDGNEWGFDGGFPREIYKRLCRELGLLNQGSHAVAVGFESYKDRKARRSQRY